MYTATKTFSPFKHVHTLNSGSNGIPYSIGLPVKSSETKKKYKFTWQHLPARAAGQRNTANRTPSLDNQLQTWPGRAKTEDKRKSPYMRLPQGIPFHKAKLCVHVRTKARAVVSTSFNIRPFFSALGNRTLRHVSVGLLLYRRPGA